MDLEKNAVLSTNVGNKVRNTQLGIAVINYNSTSCQPCVATEDISKTSQAGSQG